MTNAERSLYRDAPFILTPLSRTSEKARGAALQLIEALGAHPFWCEADEHDRILAMTSHLPYLLASALALTVPFGNTALIGPGFRSSTRLAGTPSSMMLGVLETNRENTLAALKNLQGRLAKMEESLQKNDISGLQSILDLSQTHYQSLIQ